MDTKYNVIAIVLALLVVIAAFHFKFQDNIFSMYNYVVNSFGEFWPLTSKFIGDIAKKTDIGNIISEVKKEILSPPPLNIGGKANEVVLTKAKIIAETNIQRFDNGGLPPLRENAKLDAAAKEKADEMFRNQYFEHISPSGVGPAELVKAYGYDYIVSGENLILGNFESEAEVVQDWMNSPGHRANILNTRFVDIGVAVVKGTYKGQTVWIGVQEFGLPLSSCAQPDAKLQKQIDDDKTQLDNLDTQITAKKAEIDKTNKNSSEYNKLVDEYNQLVAQYNQLANETKNLISQYNAQVNTFNECVNGK